MEGCDRGDPDASAALEAPPRDGSVIDDDLIDVDDGSVFFGDLHLPEFPCMSSSSSSSSTPAPVKPSRPSPTSSSASLGAAAASSSCATSWALLGGDVVGVEERENRVQVQVGDCGGHDQSDALASTASMEMILEKPSEEDAVVAGAEDGSGSSAADAAMSAIDACMDVMENFGYMELLEGDDMFDPTSIFQSDNLFDQDVNHVGCFGEDHAGQEYPHELIPQHDENEAVPVAGTRCDEVAGAEVGDDLGAVFLEWLRANRDSISVEDLRKVKIKKSTIETAARRFGGGKEAMKQLLKLILEWVQTNHLPRKYAVESSSTFPDFYQQFIQQNPTPGFTAPQPGSTMVAVPITSDSCFAPQWAPPPPLFTHPGMDPGLTGNGTYMGSEPMDFPMVDPAHSWPLAIQWPHYEYMENFQPALGSPQGFVGGSGFGYPGQYPLPYFSGSSSSHMKFARLGSSATKEARKKRMARQRRLQSHHHHHHHQRVGSSHRQDTSQHTVAVEQQTAGKIGSENYSTDDAGQVGGNANWMYWPPAMQGGMLASEPLLVQQPEVPPPQSFQQQIPAQQPDRRQAWKPESNLKFLLQKVLKQSDVGNLGRIVLPKKEAETHLPELEARDGISIAMEDIGTCRVWNMRYRFHPIPHRAPEFRTSMESTSRILTFCFRFWPNNKSRMYLLENTGDFVRANGLEEGDFILIYSDMKCGKYLIRGVKVRQPEGTTRAATKRPDKAQIKIHNNGGGGRAGTEK
ncbi:hypothetical protein MLD38_031719 [Melastoma candidum]|uniref:Uncharacterized protein n=1 Tax=Melastoma candidum TaxID=119954 RepID=A0ACB9MQ06_9MYRT|nr:hypothetical protein MLD38_031719 [Melastoma candidum]